jgi:hypothetical protein
MELKRRDLMLFSSQLVPGTLGPLSPSGEELHFSSSLCTVAMATSERLL